MNKPQLDTMQTVDGLGLFAQTWLPAAAPVANLALIHGFGEHSGRYHNLVDEMLRHDIAVHTFDHRGHGHSPGPRGHIRSWQDYQNDVASLLTKVRSQNQAPVFLMGHSMGALIVLDYMLQHPQGLQGGIVSGLPLQPSGAASPFLIALSTLFSHLFPRFKVSLKLDVRGLSRDPAVQAAYQADPLVHDKATARWGAQMTSTMARVREQAKQVRLPILFVHGAEDPISPLAAVQDFYVHIDYPDKCLKIYPKRRHEPHNDFDFEQPLADISAWLQAHLGVRQTVPQGQ